MGRDTPVFDKTILRSFPTGADQYAGSGLKPGEEARILQRWLFPKGLLRIPGPCLLQRSGF